jgi:acyl-CoA thioesterase-1
MRLLSAGALLLCAGANLFAQTPTALLGGNAAVQLAKTVVQMMETVSVVIPGLDRSAAGLMENARQHQKQLQIAQASSASVYPLLNDARSFLAIADLAPKPYPFPASSEKQLSGLREATLRLSSHFEASLDHDQLLLRNPDRDELRRYTDDNAKLGPPQANSARVVFFGDSITDSWRLNEYFTGRDFINRGISGQVTGEMLGRMMADVIDLHPNAMLLLAGTNDIARGTPVRTIENNIVMMAELARAHQIRVLIASLLPVSDYKKTVNPLFERTKQRPPAVINDLNRWIQNYCQQNQFTYVNYYPAMADGGGMLRDDLSDDGLHPNGKGYRVMSPLAAAALNTNLLVAPPGPVKRRRKLF